MAVVLRLEPADRVIAFDGSGMEHVVELERVTPVEVTGRVVETRRVATAGFHLTLIQGVPKGAKMDAVIRMGTELGVVQFIPLLSRRAVAEGRGRSARWRRIAVEAAKQSQRSDVPAVHDPLPLAEALALVAGDDLVLVLWEGERARTIGDALAGVRAAERVAIVVGPEGGLEAGEVEGAQGRGAISVSLDPRLLRTETAGVVALAMVLYELTLRRKVASGEEETQG